MKKDEFKGQAALLKKAESMGLSPSPELLETGNTKISNLSPKIIWLRAYQRFK
jgi:hypothetical protein